jgi:asparagine synthase (glutamine-hydrolysing)
MCGFSGFLTTDASVLSCADAEVSRMASAIQHRGPDDAGAWADLTAGVALGFRRLSILDLTKAGHQPMRSASGRFVMTFNGEIYNHAALRDLLSAYQHGAPGQTWRGHSDTETLLACFDTWGLEETLQKTVGMFAIALWDTVKRTLHLARDRFGEKPLYYGWVTRKSNAEPAFVFGSELKALCAYPGFANSVSREALALYMRFTYVPAPYSIYQNIFKLEPGCLLSIDTDEALSQAAKLLETGQVPSVSTTSSAPLRPPALRSGLRMHRWWSVASVVEAGEQNQIRAEDEALETLERRLKDAVRGQSLADVPLGAFLSGGVDSSCIVALMQAQASRPVKTFTVGFEEAGFDETPHARAVAEHLGTEHNSLFVSAKQAQAVIADLPAMYDEPFADSSQIPTHLVCKAARQQVTVALSGDAGDELFGGYNRYFWGPRIWSRLAWMPYSARQALGALIKAVPTGGWDALSRPVNALLPASKNFARAGDRAHKLAERLGGVHNLDDLYNSLVSEWQDPAQVVKGNGWEIGVNMQVPVSMLSDPLPAVGAEQHQLRMMYRDTMTYLPDDILCKVDRAAMATSLETRIPFLDHRVAELAWRLPLNMKIRDGQGKWALRQVLYKYVPKELIDRPKAGFAIPVGQWLRGPLRDWAEALLDEKRLEVEGYFYPKPIRDKWLQHLTGRYDHTPSLWAVLMFQSWLESSSQKVVH